MFINIILGQVTQNKEKLRYCIIIIIREFVNTFTIISYLNVFKLKFNVVGLKGLMRMLVGEVV